MSLRLYFCLRYLFLVLRISIIVMILFGPICYGLFLRALFLNPNALPSPEVKVVVTYFLVVFPASIWLQSFYFHRDEHPIYVNHSISRRLLYALAMGLNTVVSFVAVCFASPMFCQRVQIESLTALNKLSGFVMQPAILIGIAVSCFSLLFILVILWLSGVFDSDTSKETDYELTIDSVQHQFKTLKVLKGAWFSIKSGQMKAVVGLNGCGKSTLFRVAMGDLRAGFKMLKVNGHSVKSLYEIPGMIGYLSQKNFLPDNFRVETIARRFAGKEKAPGVLAEPRLNALRKQKLKQLSGGERRLLELRLVLALDRQFYFLDEPFSELEPLYKERTRDWIAETGKRAAVVLTDHDYRQVLALEPRLFLMEHGRLQEINNVSDLKAKYIPD